MHRMYSTLVVAGALLTSAPRLLSGIETGTGTNQTANLNVTKALILRTSGLTNWGELSDSLDASYGNQAATWSYYPAASNVNLAHLEITNAAAVTLGGAHRTNWPGQTITLLAQGDAYQWTKQPKPVTVFPMRGTNTLADLSGYTQARLTVVVITANNTASASILAQYSTDQAAWNYLDDISGPGTLITTTGLQVSQWVDLAAAARQTVYLRLVGVSPGSANKNPSFGLITLQFK